MTWDAFIRRLDLSRMPCKIDLSVRRDVYQDVEHAHLVMHVRDMHDGKPSVVNHVIPLSSFDGADDGCRLRTIRDAIRIAFEHEIDECLWFDKRQPINPHMQRGSYVVWHAPKQFENCKCDQRGAVVGLTRQSNGHMVVTGVRLDNGDLIDPSIDPDLLRPVGEPCPLDGGRLIPVGASVD